MSSGPTRFSGAQVRTVGAKSLKRQVGGSAANLFELVTCQFTSDRSIQLLQTCNTVEIRTNREIKYQARARLKSHLPRKPGFETFSSVSTALLGLLYFIVKNRLSSTATS